MSNPPQNDIPSLQNLGQEDLGVEKYMIKLLGGGKLGDMHFLMRKTVRLGRVMKIYSDNSNIALERLHFSYHGQVIKVDHTPESLKMKTDDCDIVVSLKDKKIETNGQGCDVCHSEIKKYIILIVAGDNYGTMQFKVTTTTGLWKLKRAYCDRCDTPLASVRFTYHGQRVMDDDTVEKLQMEDYDPIIVSKENS